VELVGMMLFSLMPQEFLGYSAFPSSELQSSLIHQTGCIYPAWQRLLCLLFSVKTKKKPLPGRVCFSVQRGQADTIICQMILIFSLPHFWTDADEW